MSADRLLEDPTVPLGPPPQNATDWHSNHRHLFPPFWRPDVQDQGAGGLVSPQASLGLHMVVSLRPHMTSSLCDPQRSTEETEAERAYMASTRHS